MKHSGYRRCRGCGPRYGTTTSDPSGLCGSCRTDAAADAFCEEYDPDPHSRVSDTPDYRLEG